MSEKKFRNDRYITRGVSENINPLLVVLLWEMIDNMSVPQDYLQVFNLSEEKGKQKIEHIQEVPEYRKEYLDSDTPIFTEIKFQISFFKNSTAFVIS